MDILDLVVNLFTNTDAFLVSLATDYGTLIYAAMFLIFFLETGFVIMSFLPGDSLLFVAGTVAASGTASPWLIMLAVIVGAIAGNTLGYEQGRWLGNRIYSGNISWINEKKLRHAHDFYMRHGGKTILLARFVPIVRAFAPLIAGAARMNGIRFELFSGAGAILWAVSIVGAGYLFGNIPFIKNNLSLILLLGIVAAISGPVLVGMVWKFIQKRKGLDAEDPQNKSTCEKACRIGRLFCIQTFLTAKEGGCGVLLGEDGIFAPPVDVQRRIIPSTRGLRPRHPWLVDLVEHDRIVLRRHVAVRIAGWHIERLPLASL